MAVDGRRCRAGISIPTYAVTDFDRMLRETSPKRVIVTVPDHAHCKYIVRALELGAAVITEKPLTIDVVSCRRIIAARQSTGRPVTVAFNYRYSPARALLKQVLMSGIIGRVTAVNFEWRLDTFTAPTISGAGTATKPIRAASSCTRPPIISIC
jgi:predicted dehydrogenase